MIKDKEQRENFITENLRRHLKKGTKLLETIKTADKRYFYYLLFENLPYFPKTHGTFHHICNIKGPLKLFVVNIPNIPHESLRRCIRLSTLPWKNTLSHEFFQRIRAQVEFNISHHPLPPHGKLTAGVVPQYWAVPVSRNTLVTGRIGGGVEMFWVQSIHRTIQKVN